MYDFQTSAPREQSNAEKYVLRKELFGTKDVLPAWVADMDIDTPPFVLEAVKNRLKHPIIGYEEVPSSAYEAQIAWFKRRHGVTYKSEDMFYSHSVVASMCTAIEAFSKEGEGVIVQTPVYPPFFHFVKKHNRKLILNPLKQDDRGKYTLDIEGLKAKITKDTKLLLLCSPHNPVGRVWKQEELEELLRVCLEHNIIVFSDEIHCDLVYEGYKHISFASLSQAAKDICITAVGVGKTFNMAGFAMSSIVISNENLKKRFLKVYDKIHFAQGAVLSHVAFETAYTKGDVWVEELQQHLYKNYKLLDDLCKRYPQFLKLTPIEATYLAWIDCRGLNLRDKELRDFFIKEAKLGLNPGLSFGREGSGFMRLNFGVSSAIMSEIIKRLEAALQRIQSDKY